MNGERTLSYEEAVRYIDRIPKFTKKNEPANTRRLLALLGDPQDACAIIHVAGTNGKGSVCAFLESILRQAGFRTGLFTSPHLIRINERFQINREEISDEAFLQAFLQVKEQIDVMTAQGYAHPTYFETLFAIGMVYFAQQAPDYILLETGLGGRLDATNTVEHPLLCVITSISHDHMQYLGETIPQIAGEKAGIIKEGVPVVYDGTDEEAGAVILAAARRMHAPALCYLPSMSAVTGYDEDGIRYVLDNEQYDHMPVKVPFQADYQVANSALAMMALRLLDPGKQIPDENVLRGIAAAKWSGRMEMILPGVVLDGAHNADGIRQLTKTVIRIGRTRPVSLLFAAVADKEYEEMIRRISLETQLTDVVVTRIDGSRAVDEAVFAQLFRRYTDAPVTAVSDPGEALALALAHRPPDGVLFCAGSLYLIGELKKLILAERTGFQLPKEQSRQMI